MAKLLYVQPHDYLTKYLEGLADAVPLGHVKTTPVATVHSHQKYQINLFSWRNPIDRKITAVADAKELAAMHFAVYKPTRAR